MEWNILGPLSRDRDLAKRGVVWLRVDWNWCGLYDEVGVVGWRSGWRGNEREWVVIRGRGFLSTYLRSLFFLPACVFLLGIVERGEQSGNAVDFE